MTKTNAFSILCMVIRAIALWAALTMVMGVPMFLVAFKQQSEFFGAGLICALLAAQIVVLALLWLFADKIARLALARPSDHVFESDIDASTWFGLVLAAIGAWHLFDAVLLGFRLWVQFKIGAEMYDSAAAMNDSLKWQAVGCLLEAGISVFLVLGGRGLAATLHRLRYAGTSGSAAD
jgi:hypothetical protein